MTTHPHKPEQTTPSPTWADEFDRIYYETERGLICMQCNVVFPENTFDIDLRCPDCSEIVVTPMRAYMLNCKSFIQTQIEKAKAQGRAEALKKFEDLIILSRVQNKDLVTVDLLEDLVDQLRKEYLKK